MQALKAHYTGKDFASIREVFDTLDADGSGEHGRIYPAGETAMRAAN